MFEKETQYHAVHSQQSQNRQRMKFTESFHSAQGVYMRCHNDGMWSVSKTLCSWVSSAYCSSLLFVFLIYAFWARLIPLNTYEIRVPVQFQTYLGMRHVTMSYLLCIYDPLTAHDGLRLTWSTCTGSESALGWDWTLWTESVSPSLSHQRNGL